MDKILLKVKNLKTYFYTEDGVVPAVDGVNFHINVGETLGVVGESGCGKSVTAMSILKLIPTPPGSIEDGEILFLENNLVNFNEKEMRKIRGNDISMIFQEPMTSLNPVFTVGNQIMEVLRLHRKVNKEEAKKITIELLEKVGIPRAEKVFDEYPHSLSGGMRQRAMIAMALACNPKLLIADEPTTALDVTIQAQILELMKELQKEYSTSIMFITHDLGVIAEMADRVVVMYAGHVVEEGNVMDLFDEPLHPYTKGLMQSKPDLCTSEKRLHTIRGIVPNPSKKPKGCTFNPRCEFATDKCREVEPKLIKIGDNRKVKCWLYDESVVNHNE
ncbi:ABC transporter ATP-binding protein [Caldisalinibacter kiritimatiensis]|uniref:Oligopeptide transport ATP-binding protein OppD n=1 Tax=Caldisalinibacter kiritimatiensis TaxID=1304284 RepID=R1CUT2_9FIRM|nr:ABC transporter ATP-binding protein [Caldisalinibacter kiritimatiensis]EOD00414.1 Oligopeptide transport ATP-binding protein OppD [Caldisalinibacter kiritimatiensis]